MATWRNVKAATYAGTTTTINLDLVCWMARVGEQTVVRFAATRLDSSLSLPPSGDGDGR